MYGTATTPSPGCIPSVAVKPRHPGFPRPGCFRFTQGQTKLPAQVLCQRKPPQRFCDDLRQNGVVVIGRKQISEPRRHTLLEMLDPIVVPRSFFELEAVHDVPLGL